MKRVQLVLYSSCLALCWHLMDHDLLQGSQAPPGLKAPVCLGVILCLAASIAAQPALVFWCCQGPGDCIHSWPLVFFVFLGKGVFDLEYEEFMPPCVGCADVPACLELAWGSLCGVDLSCI